MPRTTEAANSNSVQSFGGQELVQGGHGVCRSAELSQCKSTQIVRASICGIDFEEVFRDINGLLPFAAKEQRDGKASLAQVRNPGNEM